LLCRKAKYILQKPTPKIKQPTIQLAISQLFQKLKSKSTNKHDLKWARTSGARGHVALRPS
jgi:hypothetical protein